MTTAPSVAVLGGGIGGMSAAHELVQRGFAVRVYERLQVPGGKARSMYKKETGTDGRRDLPGEHGFRFFPRFYRHITDTMRRIPVGSGTAFDRLVQASRDMLARDGRRPFVVPAWFPRSVADLSLMLRDYRSRGSLGLSDAELDFFGARVWQLMTSCAERRQNEYERLGWWEYLQADRWSEEYRQLLARGVTRTLVAANPRTASTQVGGEVLTEVVFASARPGTSGDRLLDGPTSEVWLEPWLAALRTRGVDYQTESTVRAIRIADGRVAGVTIERGGQIVEVTADFYVAALPVEVMSGLLTDDMIAADPTLAGIRTLAGDVAWMNGIQYFLRERVPIVNGHVTYISSPWALTSISQAQFWTSPLSAWGDGTVRDILSVDISDWDTPGIANRRPDGSYLTARQCTREQIHADVWAQIKRDVNVDGHVLLRDDMIRDWFLDTDIYRDKDGAHNREPLLVNKICRWQLRPDAFTGIPNLFLASDYVRTNTNLATMEAANEAARRAVNGIIDASGVGAAPCRIWALYQPWVLAPLHWHDRRRFAAGLPWTAQPPLWLRPVFRIAHALGRLLARVRGGR
jgi:uncharacterized protein with NAD-binding domain and iron-sulfur cluster